MEYFNANPITTSEALIINGFVLTLGNNTVLTVGNGTSGFNQVLNVIPRKELTSGVLEITDEFTQIKTDINVSGNYVSGFFIADFVFEPILNRFYKLILKSNNEIVWKGKAKAI